MNTAPRYTVKQLAQASGVSVRTLHHYDEIGLLRPAFIGDNGYRHYGGDELLRLQQILFHRELGLPLRRIAELLDRPGIDRVEALRAQRDWLAAEQARLGLLMSTIDRTIATLEGAPTMTPNDLYQGFAPDRQRAYEQWLLARYGSGLQPHLDAARATQAGWSAGERDALQAEIADIEAALAGALAAGVPVEAAALEPLLRRHHAWVARSWPRPPNATAYAGLAELYTAHPDFTARYEALQPGLAVYMAAAMRAFAARCLVD